MSTNGVTKDEVERMIDFLDKHPHRLEVAEHTNHYFTDGLYVREMFLPKGTMLVGFEHKRQNFFHVASGALTIWDKNGEKYVEAPFMAVVNPGDQRVGYAHEDTICYNTIPNPTNNTDIASLEAELFCRDFHTAAITAAVVTVAATAYSAYSSSQARKQSKKSARAQRKADLMNSFLQRRQMLQDYRQMQATALTGAVASGADLESSGYQGVRSSLYSQADYNLRTEEKILKQSATAFKADLKASSWEGQAAIAGAVANIAGSYFGVSIPSQTTQRTSAGSSGTKTPGMSLNGANNQLGQSNGVSLNNGAQAPADWANVVNAGAFKQGS